MSALDQVRYCFPAYRVFIFGVEVTDHVVSITTGQNDGAAPNQCQLTLINEHDEYIITTQDMLAISKVDPQQFRVPWLDANHEASAGPSLPFAQPGAGSNDVDLALYRDTINKNIFQKRKRQILDRKVSIVQSVSVDTRRDLLDRPVISGKYTDYFGTKVRRYPLSDGSAIFHSMDPVRVFQRDPFDPTRWYWHFSGFVSDMVDNTNENNVKTLTIVAEDPTKLFRYTRVFVNPGILDARHVISENDLKAQSFYSNFMRGFNLPEVFYTLLFGPDMIGAEKLQEKKEGQQGSSNVTTRLRGVGHFAFDTSAICTFGPQPDQANNRNETERKTKLLAYKQPIELGDNLQNWQILLDHEVQPSDLYMMATQEDREGNVSAIDARGASLRVDGDNKILVEDVITYIGEHPEEYLVDGGRLMMLLPNSLGVDNSDILMKDIIQSYPLQSENCSAGEILMETIERIQFIMYCTPRGDLVVEPPLFDFDPDDFGLAKIPQDLVAAIGSNSYKQLGTGESKFPGRDRGPFGSKYIVMKQDTYNWESAQVDEKVYTIAVSKQAIAQNWEGLGYSDIVGDLQVVKLPDLIPLYGARQAPLTPRGYINSPEGSYLYAQIALNRLNADAHTMKISHVPNLQLWLNRPIYIQGKNCLGTTKSVTHSVMWGQAGTMDTSTDIYAIRTWSGEMEKNDPTRPLFTTIGGTGSRPLDYAMLFKKRSPPAKKVGDNVGG